MDISINKHKALLIFFKDNCSTLFHRIGFDRSVLFGILSRLWSVVTGPISLLFIAHKFSPQLQGYYYAFLSIIAFQFLVDLGLSNIIIQFASHEWSRLSLDRTGQITGEKEALYRLQSLSRLFFRWYSVASIILTLGLGIGGYFFFSKNQDPAIHWKLPWLTLCICNGIIFCLVPIWSLMEGCNQVLRLYTYRFIQGIFSSLFLWVAILSGAELWTVAISNIAVILCAVFFLRLQYRIFLKTLLFSNPDSSCVQWRKEVLPLQWRTAVTWLIGSFSFNLFVPVLFRYQGPVIAGQMGMTWSIVGIMGAIATSWISPRVPQFGILIAGKEYKKLDTLFWRLTKLVAVVTVLLAVAIWFCIYMLNKFDYLLAKRLLPPLPAGIFLLAHAILMVFLPFAFYLRAHKKEPLLFLGIIQGVLIGLSTFILGKYYSVTAVAAGYLLVNLILVPFVFVIWYRCRIAWHR